MNNEKPFVAVDINLKVNISDLAAARINALTGETALFEARRFVNLSSVEDLKAALETLDGLNLDNDDEDSEEGVGHTLAMVIDVPKYFPEHRNIKVLAVGAKFDAKSLTISIVGNKIVYIPAISDDSPWSQEDTVNDNFYYTVQNADTGEISSATVLISRFKEYTGFEDVYIELNPLYSGTIEINLEKFNVLTSEYAVTGFGVYNTALISGISVSPSNPRGIVLTLLNECACWECDWTSFEVFIKKWDVESAQFLDFKLYVNLTKLCDEFVANVIEIEVEGNLPNYIDIDVAVYNSHAFIELLQVDTPYTERGDITYTPFANMVRYTFNTGSGFWSPERQQDLLIYNIRNKATGINAKSYVVIRRKQSGGSSSGQTLNPSQSYQLQSSTMLRKSAIGPYFAAGPGGPLGGGLTPAMAAAASLFYEGIIVTLDDEGNKISLSAHIEINHSTKAFTGRISGADAEGTINYDNMMPALDPYGTLLKNISGSFKLVI